MTNPTDSPPGRPAAPAAGPLSIGSSLVLKGEVSGNQDLRIDGRIEGGVQLLENELTIGQSGHVQAQLYARSVVVLGHVTGNIAASESVALGATAVVDGNIQSPRIVMAEGAVFNGKLQMASPGQAKPATAPPPASS